MKKAAIIILTTFLMALSCGQSGSGDELSSLGFYSRPGEIIKKIERGQKDFRKNFLLATALKKEKKYKKAILYFANSCFNSEYNFKLRLFPHPVYSFTDGFHVKSPYYDDAVYEIASLFYKYGENSYVVKFIDLISSDITPLYRNAVLLKSRALVKMKKYVEAEKDLLSISEKFEDKSSLSMIKIRLASVYETSKNYQKAADTYLAILNDGGSGSWKDEIAARRLVYLKDKKKVSLDSPGALLALADALYKSKNYSRSERELQKAGNDADTPDAELLRIRLAVRKNPAKASRIISSLKPGSSRDSAALATANTLWDIRRKYAAVNIYRNIKNTENDKIAKRVLTRLSFFLEKRNRPEFITHMDSYVKRFPGNKQSGRFLWLTGRHYMKQNRPNQALARMNKSLQMFPEGTYSANCRYWIYRMKQKTGKLSINERTSLTEDLCFYTPGSTYTVRHLNSLYKKVSTAKLEKLYRAAREKDSIKGMNLYNTLLFMKEGYGSRLERRLSDFPDHFIAPYREAAKILKKMKFTGDYDEIIEGMEKYFLTGNTEQIYRDLKFIPETDSSAARDTALAFTLWGRKYSQYNLGTYYGFRLLRALKLKESLPLLPRELAETLYPMPFLKCTKRNASIYKIKTSLIYAVIKAESNFNHKAVSPVGATGLMQLMPATARGIARDLKIKKFELKDPCTSIKFGTSYLRWLNKYYRGSIEYIVSGYNAGAGNVNKWIKKYKHTDPDLFTEFTPFDETKKYIYYTNKFKIQYESIYKK